MALKARSFASLLGLKSARAESDDDEDKKKDDPDAAAAEDGDEDMQRAESDDDKKKDDDPDARAEDGDDDEDDKKKDDAKKAARSARAAERERCCRIFAHGIKAGMPELAGALAMDSDMPAAAAIATIDTQKAAGGGRRGSLAATMAGVDIPNVGADQGPTGAAGELQHLVAKATNLYNGAVGKKG